MLNKQCYFNNNNHCQYILVYLHDHGLKINKSITFYVFISLGYCEVLEKINKHFLSKNKRSLLNYSNSVFTKMYVLLQ